MNTSSLQALLIDRQMGELPAEVVELLECHLAENAEARAEADRIRQTLIVTQQVVNAHPELARVGNEEPVAQPVPVTRRHRISWLPKAAAIAALAGLAGASGFFAGRHSENPPTAAASASQSARTAAQPAAPRPDSPWARYRIAHEPGGAGLRVVGLDLSSTRHP